MSINNIDVLSKLVSTSVASYAQLSIADLEEDLKRDATGAGFSAIQATDFTDNYDLLHQQPKGKKGTHLF